MKRPQVMQLTPGVNGVMPLSMMLGSLTSPPARPCTRSAITTPRQFRLDVLRVLTKPCGLLGHRPPDGIGQQHLGFVQFEELVRGRRAFTGPARSFDVRLGV